jgi:phage baseplate assembly protein W
MAFNIIQINPADLDTNVAIGVNIPFNAPSVFSSNYLTKDAIKNNLLNFFLTNPGERYLNPLFGGGISNFIFEQITTNNTEFLIEDVSDKIVRYFPQIKIDLLEVNSQEDNNLITISLKYSIINTNISDTIEIEI